VRDEGFAAAMERMFLEDLESCEEISRERWHRRPGWLRAASWGAYLLKNWL
jgi:cardiolipin synthase